MTQNNVARQRSNSLGLAFQDVITTILRVRYRKQPVVDAVAFRESIRKMIVAGGQDGRRIGYSERTSQNALYAVVVFLDESVLQLHEPAFADWAKRPLVAEMFVTQPAEDDFFRHVDELLSQPDSFEVADALELHASCLLMGYRGKYAPGDDAQIQRILTQARDKIARVRGPVKLSRSTDIASVEAVPAKSKSFTRLAVAAALLVLIAAAVFSCYWFLLAGNLKTIQAELERSCPAIPLTAKPGRGVVG
jgi:type VI secretion system protein ImpK